MGTIFPIAYGQYQGEVEYYRIDVNANDLQYPVFVQTTFTKFTEAYYDESANSLIFSFTESKDLIDSVAITVNKNVFSSLLSTEYSTEPNKILVLINGEETPYRLVTDGRIISWVFKIPANSNEVELVSSTPRFESGKYQLEDIPKNFPKTYPPLKQWQLGIRWLDAECRGDLELVIKVASGRPSCVKSDSVEPLVWRWWATTNRISDMIDPQSYDMVKQENQFQIKYSLIGATLSEITHDKDSNSIHVKLDESQGGKLVISLPRELIDAQMGGSGVDDAFFVLIDGVEFAYGEKTSQNERTLTIHFPRNTSDVEIMGTI